MKKFVLILICFVSFFGIPLKANDDFINLFLLAVEKQDVRLVDEVIEAMLTEELLTDNEKGHTLLDALAKYNHQGRIDYALHYAIKDKNLKASIILAYYAKDVNKRMLSYETQSQNEIVWVTQNSGSSRGNKTPLELAFEANMLEIIPYLLMKKASPYAMNKIGFFYEGEENLDYMSDLGFTDKKRNVCVKSRRPFICFPMCMINRNIVAELIIKNHIDGLKLLQNNVSVDWNQVCCSFNGVGYTPLQLSLVIKRYDIAQYLINNGALIQ